MLGFTEDQIAQFGLTFGVSAFMLYMVFIIFQLARESKAGKFGTFVLFAAGGGLHDLRSRTAVECPTRMVPAPSSPGCGLWPSGNAILAAAPG